MTKSKTAKTATRGSDFTIGDQTIRHGGGLPSAAQRSSATTAKKRAAEAAAAVKPAAKMPHQTDVVAAHNAMWSGKPAGVGNSFVEPIVTPAEQRAAKVAAAKLAASSSASTVNAKGQPLSADAKLFTAARPLTRAITDEDATNMRPEALAAIRSGALASAEAAASPKRGPKTHSASALNSAIAENDRKIAAVTAAIAGKPAAAVKPAAAAPAGKPALALCSRCGRDNRRPAKTADCRNAGACAARVAALKAAVQPAAATVPAAAAVKPVAAVRKPAAAAKTAKTAKR